MTPLRYTQAPGKRGPTPIEPNQCLSDGEWIVFSAEFHTEGKRQSCIREGDAAASRFFSDILMVEASGRSEQVGNRRRPASGLPHHELETRAWGKIRSVPDRRQRDAIVMGPIQLL